jgi:hypothetical protein
MVSRYWLYFSGFVVTAILLVGAGFVGIVEGLSALSGELPASEELILLTVLRAAAQWVMVVLVLGVIAIIFLAATVVSILRTGSLPRDDRLVAVVEWLERQYPLLRRFDVSEKVEPTTEDRRQELKQQYVSGEMSEAEFERQLTQLMDDTSKEESPRNDNESTIKTEDDTP